MVIAEELEPEPTAWLAERAEVVDATGAGRAGLAAALAGADALVVRTYTRVDEALLACARRLRVVARAGVALENIDVAACRARGIEVVHTPGANTQAVVEFVLAELLDACRPRQVVSQPMNAAQWHALRRQAAVDRQAAERTLGILGFGRVGSGVGRAARALGLRVLYNDIRPIEPAGRFDCEPVALERLFAESEILSVHIDARPANAGFVSGALLSRLPPDAIVINTARGFVVDVTALAELLRARPAARAIVDVHDPYEPIDGRYPLLGLANARLTPHIAAATRSARLAMSWVVRDVWRVLSGQAPECPAPQT